ncbi:MAG: DinB family protein [Candidatus Angelobacter sp.]
MNAECLRIADQLRRAFEGEAWHGPALRELLVTVTAGQAAARPLPEAHSIWELVLHVQTWELVAVNATKGIPMPHLPLAQDWPVIAEESTPAWTALLATLFSTNDELSHAIEDFGDHRLHDTVPGRKYNFYHLFHGMTQHALYHAGQIAILKKSAQGSS